MSRFRKAMSRQNSRRSFKKFSGVRAENRRQPMRGGIRF